MHRRYHLWARKKSGGTVSLDSVCGQREARARARELADSLGASVFITRTRPPRHNQREPKMGERWRGPGGEIVRVKKTYPNRVTVVNLDGDRRDIDRRDWEAVWAPARTNPPRTPRKQRRALKSGRFLKAQHYARRSVERGARAAAARRAAGSRAFYASLRNPKGPHSDYIRLLKRVYGVGGPGTIVLAERRVIAGKIGWDVMRPAATDQWVQEGVGAEWVRNGPHSNRRGRNTATKGLPPTWVWTRKMFGPDRMLWSARDTRWEPTVPDLVSTSEVDIVRQAKEIDKYGPHGRRANRRRPKRLTSGRKTGTRRKNQRQQVELLRDIPGIGKRGQTATGAKVKGGWEASTMQGRRVFLKNLEDAWLSPKRNPIPRSIDRRSVRSVKRGRKRILIGCPKGHYHPRKKGRRKCDVGTRRINPRPEVARALATRRRWHDHDTTRAKVQKIKGPPRTIPKTLVKLGEIHQIVYSSDKYAGSPDNPKGKTQLYEHATKRPRPVLASDPDGRHSYIVGGRMKITADGLVN